MGRRARGWTLRLKGDTYQARFTVGGERFERSTGCSRVREANKKAATLYQEEIAKATPGAARQRGAAESLTISLSRWSKELEHLKSDEWHTTLEVYAQAHWIPRWQTAAEITSSSVAGYITERLAAGASPVTVRKELSGLRRFLFWALREKLLTELPGWESPKGKSDFQALCLTPAQVEKMLKLLPTKATHPKHLPVREYYALMWTTAFRRGTMARLQWSDVDLKAGTITVRPSADKREYDRMIPIDNGMVKTLRKLGPGVGLIFGQRDFRVQLQRAAEGALGKELGKRVGNHTLRHSRGTWWAENGVDLPTLQYLMGHRTLTSTARYLHGRFESARAAVDRLAGKKRGNQGTAGKSK